MRDAKAPASPAKDGRRQAMAEPGLPGQAAPLAKAMPRQTPPPASATASGYAMPFVATDCRRKTLPSDPEST